MAGNLKIIVTTSNSYSHIIPVFSYLFNRYWNEPFELVGYKKPDNLPDNCSFHSMGEQRGPQYFSDDLIEYFKRQDEYFIWCMEDTFIKNTVNTKTLHFLFDFLNAKNIGRVSLSPDSVKHYTEIYRVVDGITIYKTPPDSDYRLSTQPAIWNKNYLLKWLLPDHTPWQFENLKGTLMQKPDHEFINLALDKYHAPVVHNEGVRKRDLFQYDLAGMSEEDIDYIKSL